MTDQTDPTKPIPNDEKFKPKNVAGGKNGGGRDEHAMKDVPRGSAGDRRRASSNRSD